MASCSHIQTNLGLGRDYVFSLQQLIGNDPIRHQLKLKYRIYEKWQNVLAISPFYDFTICLVTPEGLEPPTNRTGICHSIQLNYGAISVKAVQN
jgi:hypothetical protein